MAATTVALAHFRPLLPYDIQFLFMWQNAAVDLFFCLSGFTLSYVYSGEKFRFSNYLTARIARVYPLYFVTLIAAGALYVWPLLIDPVTYPSRTALSDFLLQALMLNAWPVIGSGVHWNFPAWSISVEWFCYVLLFPLLLRQRAPQSRPARLICLVVLSAVSYRVFMNYFDEQITSADALYVAKSQWSYWVNLLRGVFGFTAGWIAYASFEKRDRLHAFCTRYATSIWLGFVAILVLSYGGLITSQALVFLFPFVVLAATDPASVMSRLLGSRVLNFLGVISYSIYMTHAIVFVLFIRTFSKPDAWPISVYVLLIGTTFVVSTATYFAIEMPARNAVRCLEYKRQSAGLPPMTP